MSAILGTSVTGAGGSSAYTIDNSLRFRSSASAYLNRTPSSTGSTQKLTYSTWVKRGIVGSGDYHFGLTAAATGGRDAIRFTGDGYLMVYLNEASDANVTTNAVYRDPSAWYHIVVAVDTTQSTASDRIKIYVNGSQVTSFSTASYPTQNYNFTGWNVSGKAQNIGRSPQPAYYFDGYLAETILVDGQQLTPSSFGETNASTGVWQPKAYAGTYGTNGFYLKFSDIATTSGSNAGLGKDFSGNGNYWNTNNISVTSGSTYDAMTDSPSVKSTSVANYCTWNPLTQSGFTTTNGNLTTSDPSLGYKILGTVAVSSGKWYWEVTASSGSLFMIGVALTTSSTTQYPGQDSSSWSWYQGNGGVKINNSTQTSYATYSAGDVIGVALDLDAGTLTFYKNGTSQGVAFSSLPAGSYTPTYGYYGTVNGNFGQRPFAYTPPSGHNRLETYNLPTPTIGASATTLANKYFNINLYTGTGSTLNITNSGAVMPNFLWIKARSGANNPVIEDTNRGRGVNLWPSLTTPEYSEAAGASVTSFNSDGFSLGTDNVSYGAVNANGTTFVAWQWTGNSTATPVTNTAGTITSSVNASTTAGFSVVTYTGNGVAGATVGHGLGVAPSFFVVKNRTSDVNWLAYHSYIGGNGGFNFNTNQAAFTSDSGYWNSTNPTSSVITLGSYAVQNGSPFVAYCWAQVAGFSSFSSYVGNGSSSGAFIYTGFRPAYVMIKRTTTSGYSWYIFDNKRLGYNSSNNYLESNAASTEGAITTALDLVSNGFKFRDTNGAWNENGVTYIYAAFAENPFNYSLAR